MEFEFGQTTQSTLFFNEHPGFLPGFERLIALSNKCFGRTVTFRNRLEELGFDLGCACREDFLEVSFLAVHGYDLAALKLLRGFYERAVALAYMIEEPNKAERFVRFAGIQEYRAMNSALQVCTEEEFNRIAKPENTASKIKERFDLVKDEFKETVCKKCATSRVKSTWDVDVASMVRKLGQPYAALYLSAYTVATLRIHATLASIANALDNDPAKHRRDVAFELLSATSLLFAVIKSQDRIFSLNLQTEIDACEKDLAESWQSLLPQGVGTVK